MSAHSAALLRGLSVLADTAAVSLAVAQLFVVLFFAVVVPPVVAAPVRACMPSAAVGIYSVKASVVSTLG